MTGTRRFMVMGALAALLGACGSGSGGAGRGSGTGSGGVASSGGVVGSGGVASSGGAVGSGGVTGSGGVMGSAGIAASGGVVGTGGVAGQPGSGGRAVPPGTGGASAGFSGSAGRGGSAGTTGASGGAVTGGASGGGGPGGTGGAAQPASLVVTSAEDAYWQTGALTPVGGPGAVIVHETVTYQTFDGFGGSFTERGWSALAALSEGDRARAMDLLFGGQGLRFSVARLPIGASDYALDRYSLDMTDSDSTPDLTLEKFSIARDMQNLIPYLRAALAVKPDLRLLADPWTPPVWMKKGPFSSSPAPSSYDGGSMSDDPATLAAYAGYLTRFVQAYASQGIDIAAVAPQATPTFQQTFPSCVWSAGLYVKFIRDYLGPSFVSQGVTAKIMLGIFANGLMDADIATAVMADPAARSFVAAIGVQDNMISSVSTLAAFGVPLLQTEQDPGNDPFHSSGSGGEPFSMIPANGYGFALAGWQELRAWLNGGVSSFLVKHMALDTLGANLDVARVWPQDALLVVDTTLHTLTITPAFHVLRHLAQFVDRGAKRVAVVTDGALEPLAFQNTDGSIVTVIYNPGPAGQTTVSVGDVTWQFAIPGQGFATVVKRP